MNKPHNLYFHVPFCISKCRYCAFYSTANKEPDWDGYCDNILSEINYWYQKMGRIDIPTIFFGGGTPSLMPIYVFEKIMNSISENFNILQNCEITLESNPGTLDLNKLQEFQKLGITRLSVGVQSLDDEKLQFLGRTHNADQAINLLNDAMDLGLNVSADFIYGLPNQSVTDVKNLCFEINKIGITHCSMYELSVEKNTPFEKMNLILPDNETSAKMYETILENLNMKRYEVSNYATPGFECRHNQNIWDGAPYIGFGRAAAGRPFINGQWYEQTGGEIKIQELSKSERAIELVITGMRTKIGINLTPEIIDVIDLDFVNNNPDLIINKNNRLSATEKGTLILDNLLVNLIK